jgi:hypothetical protein
MLLDSILLFVVNVIDGLLVVAQLTDMCSLFPLHSLSGSKPNHAQRGHDFIDISLQLQCN